MNYKFRIKDARHFDEVSRTLVKLGYAWYSGYKPKYVEEISLFAYDKGSHANLYKEITFNIGNKYFEDHDNKEAYIVDGNITPNKPKAVLWTLHGIPVYEDTVIETSLNPATGQPWGGDLRILKPDAYYHGGKILLDVFKCNITWEKFYRVKPVEEKRISVEQLVDNIVADNPGAKEVVEEAVKPTIGLRPRGVVDQHRILEILEAMHRYVKEGKEVPLAWWQELDDLYTEKKYVI